MTAKTIIQFQFGKRSAIEAIARSKAAFFTGIILVLLTAIPRNYDQLAVSEQPLKWGERLKWTSLCHLFDSFRRETSATLCGMFVSHTGGFANECRILPKLS